MLPTGGPTAQVCRVGTKVGGRLALFCNHRVNRVNYRNDSVKACFHYRCALRCVALRGER